MIKLKNIYKSFGQREILKNVNMEIHNGETLAIIGGSGSGKSTLLRLMIGLLRPTDGEIWIDDTEISKLKEEELDKIRLNMGMVFQYSALFDSMDVGENVAFGLREHTKLDETEIQQKVAEKLAMVGLAGRQNDMPSNLSGGMKKRVSLARAIAIEPAIVFYDEPTAGLDPLMSARIDELIVNTQKLLHVTSVVVTHHMESAFYIADRIAMVHDGSIIALGTVDEIKHSKEPVVQEFIGGGRQRRKK